MGERKKGRGARARRKGEREEGRREERGDRRLKKEVGHARI